MEVYSLEKQLETLYFPAATFDDRVYPIIQYYSHIIIPWNPHLNIWNDS